MNKNCEELIKTLTDKLEIQHRELQSIKSKLYKKSQWENKRNVNRSYDTSSQHQPSNSKCQQYISEDYCYKEYTYIEREYYPRKPYSELRKVTKDEGFYGNKGFVKEPEYFTPKFVPGDWSRQNKNVVKTNKCAPEPKPLSEAVLKVRQNHHPFLFDVAYKTRTCRACKKCIKKGSTVIMHKEIAAFRSEKYGWAQPIYSQEPIAQFYHFDQVCLRKRGFEDNYLSLCYVEVTPSLSAEDKAKIHDCGFKRPIRERALNVAQTKVLEVKDVSEKDVVDKDDERKECESVDPGGSPSVIKDEERGSGKKDERSDNEDGHAVNVEDVVAVDVGDTAVSDVIHCENSEDSDFDFCS